MSDINHAAVKVWALEITADEYGNPLSAVAMAQAYLDVDAKLTKMSKYMSDCTPLQSDDFSRGESYGADCCARLINDVLDGKTDGVMCEPLGSARQRLIDRLADLDAKLEAANESADELQSRLDTVTASHCEMLRELQAERHRSDRLAKLEKNYPLYRAYYDLCFPPKGTPASEIETLHDEFLTTRDNRLTELEQENAELRARLEGRDNG